MLFVVAAVVVVVVVVIVHMHRLPVHFLPFISYFIYTLKAKTKEYSVKTMNKQFHLGFREQ